MSDNVRSSLAVGKHQRRISEIIDHKKCIYITCTWFGNACCAFEERILELPYLQLKFMCLPKKNLIGLIEVPKRCFEHALTRDGRPVIV